MNRLERRYRRLLWAYPANYRRERSEEIVGTYLDLAGPGRRWPSPADVADLVRGGLRQRLRAAGANDLLPGVRLAALLALTTATFLAGFWAVLEWQSPPAGAGVPAFGPFVSIGAVAWFAWLLAALLTLVAPGRPTRAAVAAAMLLTATTPLVSLVIDVPRPPLYVLLPPVVLGVLALAVDGRLPLAARVLPITAALAGASLDAFWNRPGAYWGWYNWTAEQVLPAAGGALLAVALLLAVGLGIRRDRRGWWTVMVLLTPVGLLNVHPLAGAVDGLASAATRPTYPTMVATAITVGLLGAALLPAAVALRRRQVVPEPVAPCPTCGAHR
ncbi:hypothetical protein E0H26_27260 [Micromonospora zingiberis]|uniref:Uncharacterized protein n=1 Tax=Micromonospora zingiberis TaxID=2053011 RepID=A0A4R0G2R6_9ACTN|nr:hypothetical protein [Micromonospora zingiberis]TCB90277.1 hypothetical protein E0H26_27260 [Micromonospora zingiberis]